MNESAQQAIDTVVQLVTVYGLSVVSAVVILILGFIVAGYVKRWIRRAGARSEHIDATLASFFASLARYAIIAFTIIAVLAKFGIETTSMVALLGAIGLAIGFALQGTLSNIASGIMLLFFRPFKIGDFVDAGGTSGTVKQITLFFTELATPDNVQIIVPNSAIWGEAIKNFSFNATRRVDLVMGIGYGDDIDKAMTAITDVIEADTRVHKDPAPTLAVGELADSSVNIIVRVWCTAGDYWAVKWDLTKAIKETFDARGIEIPYPHQVTQLVQMDASA
ncbi:MAG: mechanosensitive ion channel [Sphingomonadales bacterium]|nr:mechanosensitive ion channel [Sphingomonadales bacterium]